LPAPIATEACRESPRFRSSNSTSKS